MNDRKGEPDASPPDTAGNPSLSASGADGGAPASAESAESRTNIVPLHEALAEVGGLPDECGVTLAIYGDDLDPDEITHLLGVRPTRAHRQGDRPKPDSRFSFPQGAWFLERRGTAPVGPDELTNAVLDLLPTDPERWRPIWDRFDIQVCYRLHFSGWNKGFALPRELVARIAAIGALMSLDIYAYGEDEGLQDSRGPLTNPSHEPAS